MIDVVLMAVWFGLVTGLVEGAGFMTLQQLGWLNWNRMNVPVALEIVWVAPFLDVLLFGGIGVALAAVARLLPRVPLRRYAFPLFVFLVFYDWVALSGHIYHYAIITLALGVTVVLSRWFHRHEAGTLRFLRRSLPGLAIVTLLAFCGIEAGQWLQERAATAQLPPAPTGSPNILVIVVDTLRADHLSGYGYSRPTSPNLDLVARHGVLFENAFSASSWTMPSHASLVTGRYTYEHQAETRPLDNHYPTIGEALLARGYRTGAFSGNVYYFNRWQGFGRGFIHFEDFFHSFGDMFLRTLYGREARKYVLPRLGVEDIPGRKRAADINRAAVRWIERDRSRPFFAFLNYLDPHDPYVPPQPYRTMFATLKHPGGILNQEVGRYYPDMTPAQLQGEIDAYDGAIAYTDDNIAHLLADLQERGAMDNTYVIITADHGESFGEHGLFLHQNALYRELIRVPLIVYRPGYIPAGVRVAPPVSNVALAATVMEFAGAADQTLFPPPSLSRYWRTPDGGSDWPDPVSELAKVPFGPPQRPSYHGAMKSLLSLDWHYIAHDKFGVELYDWKSDPGELRNLAQRPELQDVVSQMRAQLASRASRQQARGHDMSLPRVRGENAAGSPGG